MRATIAWSHDLLAPEHRRLFRRLSVFAGGCTPEAAEAVAAGPAEGPFHVLEGLTALADLGLLCAVDDADAEPRFRPLETIREDGLERLAAVGEEAAARTRHAAWCLALAEAAEPTLVGPDQARWFARLVAEHDNLRAALGWSIERGEAETALRLAGAIQRFWTIHALLGEGRRWLDQALAIPAAVPPAIRAKAPAVAARVAYFQGDYGPAALLGEEALAVYRALGDATGTGVALRALALVAEATGDDDRAATLYEEARDHFRRAGNGIRVAAVVNDLGMLAWRRGDVVRATALQEEAVARARELGDRGGLEAALCGLALATANVGDDVRAAVLAAEMLAVHHDLGNTRGLLDGLETFDLVADARRDDERAARLFGAAEALRRRVGVALVPKDRAFDEPRIAAVRARLGEAAFAAAWSDGEAMSLDDALAFALEPDHADPPRAPPAREAGEGVVRAS